MPHKILILEDEAIAALDLEARLTSWGHTVIGPCANAQRALELAEGERPDLALLDVEVAGQPNGIFVAAELRRRWSTPALFLTAYAHDALVEEAKASEPLGYLVKPYSERDLFAALEVALAKTDAERKSRETAEELSRFKVALDDSPDGVFMYDPDTLAYVYVNDAACKQLGYAPEDLLRMKAHQSVPALTEDEYRERLAPLAAGEKADLNFEEIHQRRNGTRLTIQHALRLVHLPGGPSRFVDVRRDVTEFRSNERSLARSLERERRSVRQAKDQLNVESIAAELGSALNTSEEPASMLQDCAQILASHPALHGVGIWTATNDGNELCFAGGGGADIARADWQERLSVSDSFAGQIFAKRTRRFRTLTVDDACGIAGRSVSISGATFASGYPLVVEHVAYGVLLAYSQREIDPILQRALDRASQQIALGLHRKVLQIANRDQAEERIRESYEALRQVLDGSADAVLVVSSNEIVRFANRAAVALFEGRLGEGDDIGVFLGTESGLEIDVPCAGGAIRTVEMRSGHTRWFEEPCTIFTFRDVTERKLAAATLTSSRDDAIRSSRAKDEFLSSMSHELRTPLNAILGFSQILELERLSEKQRKFVKEIKRAGGHLLTLISELLDLSSIESGKIVLHFEDVPVETIITETLHLIEPLARERNLTVSADFGEIPTVRADPIRLKQILLNLLANAAKYNVEGGRIEAKCQPAPDGRSVRISIRDTGPGISPEIIERLFVPFDRLGAETSSVEGTGIGLALCARLAGLMATKIGVDSRPGEGSTFWIDLRPARSLSAAENVAGPETPVPPTSDLERIVAYVEDDPANLEVVKNMLAGHPDWRLVSAPNGEDGLALVRQALPAVVLLDIDLPDMDGYAFLRVLRNAPATRHIPVLALSADTRAESIDRGLIAGFSRYLTKPVTQSELIEALAATIESAPDGVTP